MNLEKMNLVELNDQEVQEVEGGGLFTFIALGLLIIGVGLLSNHGKRVNGPGGNGQNETGYYKQDLLSGGAQF